VEGGLLDVVFSASPGFNSARKVRYMKIDNSRLVRALDDPDVARWHTNLAERSDLPNLRLIPLPRIIPCQSQSHRMYYLINQLTKMGVFPIDSSKFPLVPLFGKVKHSPAEVG
jgi:hypothetical protein